MSALECQCGKSINPKLCSCGKNNCPNNKVAGNVGVRIRKDVCCKMLDCVKAQKASALGGKKVTGKCQDKTLCGKKDKCCFRKCKVNCPCPEKNLSKPKNNAKMRQKIADYKDQIEKLQAKISNEKLAFKTRKMVTCQAKGCPITPTPKCETKCKPRKAKKTCGRGKRRLVAKCSCTRECGCPKKKNNTKTLNNKSCRKKKNCMC